MELYEGVEEIMESITQGMANYITNGEKVAQLKKHLTQLNKEVQAVETLITRIEVGDADGDIQKHVDENY